MIDVDIGKSCKTTAFRRLLPKQYLNVGIAEQNGAGIAAGLATCGKIPFVVTYAAFGSMRMCEMLRQEICYPKLNVKLACSHGGVTPANDGASHQCIEDMGILRTIPNMTVVMPADYQAAKNLVWKAAELDGPVYLRFTRDAVPCIYGEDEQFEIGKAKLLRDGNDISIIATGDTVCLALEAAKMLENGSAHYCAAKAGIIGFARAQAMELCRKYKDMITVNCVCPGLIATDIRATLSDEAEQESRKKQAMGRAGTAREVANAIVWLASEEASYVSGEDININGVIRLAIAKKTPESLAYLEQCLNDLRKEAFKTDYDIDRAFEADNQFHKAIMDIVNNEMVEKINNVVLTLTNSVRYETTKKMIESGRAEEFVGAHEKMYQLLAESASDELTDIVAGTYFLDK